MGRCSKCYFRLLANHLLFLSANGSVAMQGVGNGSLYPPVLLSLQINCCVDETAAVNTHPLSFLRFVPPFASTLPHRDHITTDPILRTGVRDQTTPWGGRGGGGAPAATEPLFCSSSSSSSSSSNNNNNNNSSMITTTTSL